MGAYGSPELPPLRPSITSQPPAGRRRGSGTVRLLRALRRVVVVGLCVLGGLAVLGGVLQATGAVPAQNTAVVGR